MCNEFSELKTGYSIYGKEILTRLFNTNKFEIFEHACYVHHSDPRTKKVPWVIYANLPDKDNQEQVQQYNSNPSNQFGVWRFEEIVLDCQAHITIDIRDKWMCNMEFNSPLRPYYHFVPMPTVDSYPQNKEWISDYETADGVFTYQDWSTEVLNKESANKIKTLGSASPAADDAFKPMDGFAIKKSIGLEKYQIIGTVMRNQRRKLFPDLFYSFRKFLDITNRNDVLLYCHTSYPDMGWDIPSLLLQYNIASKTLFTYVCRECGNAHPHFFSDALIHCPRCGKLSSGISNVQVGVDNKVLSAIYNMFDVYIQYSIAEGFGMPQLEAAACGIPVMAVDYSAMTDVVRKLKGIPIPILTLTTELETGCYRAVPNNEKFIEILIKFFNLTKEQIQQFKAETRQAYLDNYNWDNTAKKWENYFDSIDIEYYEHQWRKPPRYTNIPNDYPKNISNAVFARWLITSVLGEPRYINSYMESRLIRDLNYGTCNVMPGGLYFNEHSALYTKPNWQQFGKEEAFKQFVNLGQRKNYWEKKRWDKVQQI